jgi:carbon storage regulator
MLVVTRRRHETIMIGDGIEVQVLRVGRDGVRLGVIAPPHVQVHRREIYEQICEANRAAASASTSTSADGGTQDAPSLAARLRARIAK